MWLTIITFIINTISQLGPIIAAAEPIIEQIWAEIQNLINSGQPVPASMYAQLASAQQAQINAKASIAGAYAMLQGIPPAVMAEPAHKALLAQLKKTP
jgi:hypothetical protein